jgi:hypothetical protein
VRCSSQVVDQLERASALRREGALSDAEFEAQQTPVLDGR